MTGGTTPAEQERIPWRRIAYSARSSFYVSTILRESSAIEGPRTYYETLAFSLPAKEILYEYAAGYERKALRAHATIARRLERLAA